MKGDVACVPARLSPAVMWGDKEETSIFSGSETNVGAVAAPCVICPIITGFGHLLLPQSCAFHSWRVFWYLQGCSRCPIVVLFITPDCMRMPD